MIVEFNRRFLKDLEKINQTSLNENIKDIISEIEKAESILEIDNLKKLKGYKLAYRIRSGDYRIGLFIENSVVEFARIAHRKDIYKVFP